MIKNISNLGDAALYCDFGKDVNKETNTQVIRYFKSIQNENIEGVNNLTPSYNKLIISFDLKKTNFKDLKNVIENSKDVSYKEAFYMARETWQNRGVKQQCHHSNSKKKYEDDSVRANAHSDWYYTPFENFGEEVDVVLECKRKERALLKYRQDFQKNNLTTSC